MSAVAGSGGGSTDRKPGAQPSAERHPTVLGAAPTLARGASSLALALAVPLNACSYYSQADGERLRDEVFALKTQVTALQRTLQELQSSQERSAEKLGRIAKDVSELNTAARRNDADIGVVLDVVRQDVARMKGQVELLQDRMSEVESKSEKTKEELELRFQGLAAEEKIREAESAKEAKAAAQAAKRRSDLLDRPKEALAEAERLIAAGSPADARRLLRALEIEQRGKRRWKIFAPQAQYLIGETYFAEKDYQQAAAAFNVVRKKYRSNKTWVPGSILKLGECFERLGLKDDAQLFYQTVSEKYPKHPAGQEGRRRLAKIKG